MVVENTSTVVIGGLIDDNLTITDYKVPFLGDIPFLGWLFKSEGRSTERTNLYIFLTPKVVKHPREAVALNEEKKTYMEDLKQGRIKLYRENMTFPPEDEAQPVEPSRTENPADEPVIPPVSEISPKAPTATSKVVQSTPPAPTAEEIRAMFQPDMRHLPGYIGTIGLSR